MKEEMLFFVAVEITLSVGVDSSDEVGVVMPDGVAGSESAGEDEEGVFSSSVVGLDTTGAGVEGFSST